MVETMKAMPKTWMPVVYHNGVRVALKWRRGRRHACDQHDLRGGDVMINPYNPVETPIAYDFWEAEVRPTIDGSAIGTDGKSHACTAGYDGRGVYAWSCLCGAAESDHTGLDAATIASVEHLDELGALVEA